MIKSKIFWITAVIIILGISSGIFLWYQRTDKTMPYDPVRVEFGDMKVTVLTTGIVQPQNRLEIKSPIAGRIEKVLAKEGNRVQQGQVIAWLSSTERAALLDAARAKGPEKLAYWKDLYNPTPLMAPINGDIIARNIEPGQTITAQDVLLVISDRLIIEAQLDETDIGHIALGQSAEITLDAYPNETMIGKIDHIAYEAKTVNNVTMYMVDVLPESVPDFLRSGMTANVQIIMAQTNHVLLLPSDAVYMENNRTVVRAPNTKDKTKTLIKNVKTGLSNGRDVEITSGLKQGDTVLRKAFTKRVSNDKTANNPFMPFRRKKKK